MSDTIEFEDDNAREEYLQLLNKKARDAVRWEMRAISEDSDGTNTELEWDHIADEYFGGDQESVEKFKGWYEERDCFLYFIPTDESYQREFNRVKETLVDEVLGEGRIMTEEEMEEFINEKLSFTNFELDWILTYDEKERDTDDIVNRYLEEVSEI